jgi:hypothetical protein
MIKEDRVGLTGRGVFTKESTSGTIVTISFCDFLGGLSLRLDLPSSLTWTGGVSLTCRKSTSVTFPFVFVL